MKQFKPYPIYVSGNTLTEQEIEDEIQRRLKEYDRLLKTDPKFRAEIEEAKRKYGYTDEYGRQLIREQQMDANLKTSTPFDDKYRFLEAMRPDSSPKAVKFENTIIEQLKTIHKTEIGKLFFDSFNPKKKLWITLLEGKEQADCNCFAQTDDAPIKDHVQIKYPMLKVNKGEDILFHEIVHAYRRAAGLEVFQHYKEKGEYISVEEFVATLFQNIYRSCIGEQQFYRYSKINLRVLPQKDYYDYLGSHVEVFGTLKEFLWKEPLALKVSRWAYPNFNPLRDFSEIKKIFYNNIVKERAQQRR
jgi:hypothetical protein